MDVTSLPNEVIDKIIEFCPEHIQYSFWKPQSFAPSAYKHNYKRVKIGNKDDPSSRNSDTKMHYKRETEELHRLKNFSRPKSLIKFYKTHPLYFPDTIDISGENVTRWCVY